MDLYIYGAGNRGKIIVDMAKNTSVRVVGIIDSNQNLQGTVYGGFIIQSPDVLYELSDVNICVSYYSSLLHDNVWNDFQYKYGIQGENIYSFNDIMIKIYENICILEPNVSNHMKYLFIGNWTMGLGGVESWLRDIMVEFAQREIENLYLVTNKKDSVYSEKLKDRIVDFAYDYTPTYTREYIERGIVFLTQNLPCKIVFSRVDELVLAAYLVKKKYPQYLEIIMVDHGACDGMSRDIASYDDVISQYIAVSSGIKKLLADQGIEEAKIKVMTCPINYVKQEPRVYQDEYIRIGYAGRLEIFEKRMDVLLKFIEELELCKINYKFEIAGSGTYIDYIKNFIHERHLENKVHLLGLINRADIPCFWNRQDIAINVSDNEGRPLSNMEAMLYGAVPIVTETIGSLEDVKHEENGYVVPIGDYKRIVDYVKILQNQKSQLKKMSRKAHNSMRDKLSMDRHMDLWRRVLFLN